MAKTRTFDAYVDSDGASPAERIKIRRTVSYDPRMASARPGPEHETRDEHIAIDISEININQIVRPTELQIPELRGFDFTRAGPSAGPGSFCHKLYLLMLDPANSALCGFSESGETFRVYNNTDFAREVLPKQFKHSNFNSFVRQLNMYAFAKVNKLNRSAPRVKKEDQIWEFQHKCFIRGRPDLLPQIKRKQTESVLAAKSLKNGDGPAGDLTDSEPFALRVKKPSWRRKHASDSVGIAPRQLHDEAPATSIQHERPSPLPVVAGPPMSIAPETRSDAVPSTAAEDTDPASPTISNDRLEQLELEAINLRFDHEALEARLEDSERRNTQLIEVIEDLWSALDRHGIELPYDSPHLADARRPLPDAMHRGELQADRPQALNCTGASAGPPGAAEAPQSAPAYSMTLSAWMDEKIDAPLALRSLGRHSDSAALHVLVERPSHGTSFRFLSEAVEEGRVGPDSLAPAIEHRLVPPPEMLPSSNPAPFRRWSSALSMPTHTVRPPFIAASVSPRSSSTRPLPDFTFDRHSHERYTTGRSMTLHEVASADHAESTNGNHRHESHAIVEEGHEEDIEMRDDHRPVNGRGSMHEEDNEDERAERNSHPFESGRRSAGSHSSYFSDL